MLEKSKWCLALKFDKRFYCTSEGTSYIIPVKRENEKKSSFIKTAS